MAHGYRAESEVASPLADLSRLADLGRIEQHIRGERFVERHLDDLLGYVAAVRGRLGDVSDG
jgi:hypothetical protein